MSGRATKIVQSLRDDSAQLSSAQVFEAFAELDQLPQDEVRAALVPLTGPAPDPETLEDSIRIVHGFPLAPKALHCTVRHRPIKADQLALVAREQVVKAGKQWDGVELDVSGRVSDPVFSEGLEMRTFADARGRSVFDVVLHGGEGGESGTIFASGTSNVVGSVAYGNVEMRDRARRLGLTKAIAESASMVATAPVLMPTETPSSAAPTLRWLPETGEWEESPELGDAQTVVLPGRYETDPRILASQIDTQVMPVVAPAPPRAPKPVVAPVVAAAEDEPITKPQKKRTIVKKKAAPVEEVVVDAEIVVEEAPKSKKTATKVAAKKTATKKVAAKKTGTKKVAAKKTATKKVAAKKTATKKVAAKKTATKKVAAKKPSAKKTATKKVAAKKPAAKKAAAKKTATKKVAAKKPAAKKAAAKKR